MRRDSHGSLNPACRALLAVVAALAVVPAAGGTLPCPESRPMLPLLAGTRWVYRGMVVSTVGGEYSDAHVVRGVRTRTMDVRTVEYEAGTTVALVEGFPAELDWYEDIGLCDEGEAEKLLRSGETTIGGRIPVNPSGGLACFGEAVPAQAIAQVCELTWQLRGQAGGRQVEGAKVGLSINQGLFGHGSSVILKT